MKADRFQTNGYALYFLRTYQFSSKEKHLDQRRQGSSSLGEPMEQADRVIVTLAKGVITKLTTTAEGVTTQRANEVAKV
ncbi:hypothetical protein PROFUN_07817 [Planoprotostelium fungivorum]|uniref:Uncharacterized protein n=1 Tax=Planoprotostelium fungivorum TaxID=1890364 RepID=A0A2P6MX61_9EUKA|nr:hypothetical protein PROFUN_07817 [Planoprotostelium fungivorum]